MKQKTYEFVYTQNFLWFEFESESVTKIVRKVVIFSPLPDNEDIYNIVLVDVLADGSFSDNVTTDNKDLVKVVATVVKIVFSFLNIYPSKLVYVEGNSKERTRLYRIIISRELQKVEAILNIYGVIEDEIEFFKRNTNYHSFVIGLKSHQNLLNLLHEDSNSN